MRLGIRLQLLFALGSLLVLAFLPLFFAVASLTRASLAQVRAQSAASLGRAVAGHVTARAQRSHAGLYPLLDAQIAPEGVAAIALYDLQGALLVERGEPSMTAVLPRAVAPGTERIAAVQTSRGAALVVVVPGDETADLPSGAVGVLVRTDLATTPSTALVRLFALYTGIVALALLVFTYISMTRLVVQPIDRLSRAARRVAEGARHLEAPRQGGRELLELGQSLEQMTAKLVSEEAALRAKVAEVERYAQDLARAQERLVRSERLASVGRLAAGLAHEIGNPIAAILGFEELLLQGGLDAAEQKDFLERMKRETERIHRILRDLLDFARPAVHRPQGEPDPEIEAAGDLREAVNDVVALVKPQKALRDVDLRADVAPDVPRVTLSHQRIVQVVLNLVLNAADAAPRGRVTVRAVRGTEGKARVEVEDDGPGIAVSVRERLFEPFVTTKPVGEGTGLGLAVCRGLVEAVGGTIAVETAEGGGARFVVELPEEATPSEPHKDSRRSGVGIV
jgi:two-component system NtrC family sensor kinase